MFQAILDWSEVWALLIPLLTYLTARDQPRFFQPILVYLWGALLLNVVGDTIGDFKRYFPAWLQSNLLIYSIHSLFRFVCFICFFNLFDKVNFKYFRNTLLGIYVLCIISNYSFIEDSFDTNKLNGNLFTIEAYILLIFCILYYLSQLQTEVETIQNNKDFWIVTGLSIYVVVNFFVFLFYVPMIQENSVLADQMWSVHNLAYITLCLFITKAIYVPVQPNY